MSRSQDAEFMRDLRAAVMRPPRLAANTLLFAIVTFFALAVFWASRAPLDEVTTGMGQVIPSGKVQVVQNLEGGIVSDIRVREGEEVAAGDVLLLIDNTQFLSNYEEDRAKYLGLRAAAARLRAEVEGRDATFPDEVRDADPALVRNEFALHAARKAELDSSIAVLRRQVDQKRQELVELDTRITQAERAMALAEEELAITQPMVERGVTSRIDLIRLRREMTDIETNLLGAQQAVPRAQAALEEAENKIAERHAAFRKVARAELNEAELKISALSKVLTLAKDRLARTEVRAPVTGTVKTLNVNTVGGVIKPGEDLVEIVPREDRLLVEARIRPSDIAFLRPGQDARVKVTAYDYAVYGSMDAELVHISADTVVDDAGESYFLVRVRTDVTHMGDDDARLPIIPGMVAEVDVLTGRKTVLDYLLKPILRARDRALRER